MEKRVESSSFLQLHVGNSLQQLAMIVSGLQGASGPNLFAILTAREFHQLGPTKRQLATYFNLHCALMLV